MSAKLPYHPTPIDRSPVTSNAPVDGAEQVLACVRRIQADAEQICKEAADIEDARFLAENIVDTCRRFLSNENGSSTNPNRAGREQADDSLMVAPSAAGSPDSSRDSTARAKLGRLSARELEIFTHLAEGRSAAEIADKLSRSSKTINNHRTRILQKLELKNAAELVRLALRSGVVSV